MWRMQTLAFLGLLVIAGPAAASHETIPPDNSGVGQYTENLPGAGGDNPSSHDPGGGSGGSGSEPGGSEPGGTGEALPPGAEGALDSLAAKGPVGAAAAAALERAGVQAGAPDSGAPDRDRQGAGSAGEDDGSVLGKVLGQLTGADSDGMGIALPIILALSLVAALLLFLARRQGRAERSV